MENLLILGAGGYGRSVREAAVAMGCFGTIAFLDDRETDNPNILARCGAYRRDTLKEVFSCAYAAFGDNDLRYAWLRELRDAGYHLPQIIHPKAYVSPSSFIDDAVVILANACVAANTQISVGGIVNMGAIVDHDCVLGACVHIAPGAIVKAGNHLEALTKIESGTVLMREQ